MAQPVICSATILRLIGCGPVRSATDAMSSQLSVAAEILGRRKRNAAPPMEAKTAASGRNLRNERRDVSTVMFVHLHAFDGEAPGFLPLVRQDYRIFKIDRILSCQFGKSCNLFHKLHSARRLGRITSHL